MFLGNFVFFTTTMITLLKLNSQTFLVIFNSLSDIYALSFGKIKFTLVNRSKNNYIRGGGVGRGCQGSTKAPLFHFKTENLGVTPNYSEIKFTIVNRSKNNHIRGGGRGGQEQTKAPLFHLKTENLDVQKNSRSFSLNTIGKTTATLLVLWRISL